MAQRSHADSDDEDDDYDEVSGGNRLLGFMFGNVDGSGDLDVDYLDEDAKEHIAALADKLGSSLTDINLSIKLPTTPADASEQDYDEKAEDAVDYEDIEEQYEGPEVQAISEEEHLLRKSEYFSAEISLASLDQRAIFDEENYDEDEDFAKGHEVVENNSEAETTPSAVDNLGLLSEKEKFPDDNLPFDESIEAENVAVDLEDFLEEEAAALQETFDGQNKTSLPVLCIEDGKAVLRFSEIFGIHEPLKKREKKHHHRYSVAKESYKATASSLIVEEDEEAFLRGSCQSLFLTKSSGVAHDEYAPMEGDMNAAIFGVRQGVGTTPMQVDEQIKDPCLCAQPMKEGMAVNLSAGCQAELYPELYPLDQQDWEDAIIWENSPVARHGSSESCVISGADSDAVNNAETEVQVRLQNLGLGFQMEPDEKDHNLFLHSYSVIVEPFGSRNLKLTNLTSSQRSYHPQILRLESHFNTDETNYLDVRKDSGTEELSRSETIKNLSKLSLQNKELLEGSWLDKIIWDPGELISKPKLILDLQDEQMLFEILDNKDGRNLHSHARAMIITRSLKAGSEDSFDLPGQGGASIGRFNISNDKYYSNRKTSQQSKSHAKKRAVHGLKVMHSVPALRLQTMKPKLSNKDIANFHRPKAQWYPHDNGVAAKEQGKLSTQGPINIILKSMGGKGSKLHVDAEETVASLKGKALKKLDFKPSEKVKVFYSGKELEDVKSLATQNVRPNSLLHLVRTKIHLWPRAQKLPSESKPLRPPGAFKKKSELSVKTGHVFLMEYCEERPLLLGNVGMGARVCTYYQKSAPGDPTASLLRNGNNSLGNVITLDPADKSPFLGDIRPGSSQSCLETNMYRAPMFPHKLSSTDYLLVRSAKGRLSLRRIDRIHVVGQQEPHMEVISPGSKNLQTYISNRLLVHIYREFRANEKPGFLPRIRADELSALFPNLSEPFLRKRLKHCADLQKGPNGQLLWVMRRSFRIPLEEELRRLVTPENVCAYESMQAGLYRLKRLGISRLTNPSALSSAMNQLPDEAIALAAASHIERELQITPWNLSSNFVACTNQDRENIERLEITGVGDPSGRGLGFSYVRVAPKAPISSAMVKKKTAVARGPTTVTGTDADLRRLSMDAAREVLVKFNVPEEQIEKMTRWHRIAMVRKLSSEQASSGVKVDATTLSKFARGQRMSFLQLQQQTREKCQEIWDRQLQSLSAADGDENESDSEANSDLDSFAGDLENLLDAEECEEGEEGNFESKRDKVDGVKGLKMRRRPSETQAEEEIEDEAAEAAELWRMLMDDDEAKGKKKKTRPLGKGVGLGLQVGFGSGNVGNTKKRVRIPLPDGSYTYKEIFIGDQKEGGNFLARKDLSGKVKAKKGYGKNDDVQTGVLKKKFKAIGDGFKKQFIKEKRQTEKPVREGFVCGACGQLGHMRTNKNCPKYGEDTEIQVDNTDLENTSGKTHLDVSTHLQPKVPIKKLVPKGPTKNALIETPENTEKSISKSSMKALPLKLKCGPSDKSHENITRGAQTSDKQITTDAEIGSKPVVKISKIKISSKMKAEDTQIELPKPSVIIRPPSEIDRNQSHKKIIIKQPKGIINVEQGLEKYSKTIKMIHLSSFDKRKQKDNTRLAKENAKMRAIEERRYWEEEEKRRSKQRIIEERNMRLYAEEQRIQEEQERLHDMRMFEEAKRKEREEWEKEKKKKKKKQKKVEVREEYLEDSRISRNDRRIPERDRAAKKRPVVDLGWFATAPAPQTKRRRGGEVVLSNILESIVDNLKKYDVSFLFLKPVSKKEAPDYLDIIEKPMDLSTIREKIRKMEYKSKEEFRHDMWQITFNAHKYNDRRNPTIPPLADQLLEICDYMLDDNKKALIEAESGIELIENQQH